ncbi:MAG: hypothetical protein NWF05_05295 [Candidatus Bathyarchaeota archaeon]|nr:hypothetical protein [Candidatus Bathyarchaeota archaeon]
MSSDAMGEGSYSELIIPLASPVTTKKIWEYTEGRRLMVKKLRRLNFLVFERAERILAIKSGRYCTLCLQINPDKIYVSTKQDMLTDVLSKQFLRTISAMYKLLETLSEDINDNHNLLPIIHRI